MAGVTLQEIRAKLGALDDLVVELGNDFDHEAELSVAGDADAGKRAADIDRRLDRLGVDRRILDRALARASAREIDALNQAAAERRNQHYEQAKADAAKLVEIADRVDSTIDSLLALISDLSAAEGLVQTNVRASGRPIENGRVGRHGLHQFAVERITKSLNGRAYEKSELRTGHWARVGWRELLEPVDE